MNAYEITEAVISVLKATEIPVFQQFDLTPAAKRNDCFITVGIEEYISSADSSAVVTVSLFAPSSYSGGKILRKSKDITPSLMNSGLSVESVRAKALSYDRALDRLRYDFSVKINLGGGSAPSGSTDVEISDNITVNTTSFTVGRKRAISEIESVASGVFLGDGGNRLITLEIAGTTATDASECVTVLDGLECGGETVSPTLAGIVFPAMRLKSYTVSVKNGRTQVTAEFVSAEAGEGLTVSE